MIGAFLGWRALPVTLMLGSVTGSLVGVALIVFSRREARVPIPFARSWRRARSAHCSSASRC